MFRKLKKGVYELTHDVRVNVGPFQWVDLRAGSRTNFASIPRVLHWLVDPDANDIALAALVHDSLVGEFGAHVPIKSEDYTSAHRVPLERYPDWHKSAQIFRGLMYDLRAPTWKRLVCYAGVRLYGLYSEVRP